MRRFSFFLSSETYKNYPSTPYCHADAELLKNTLIEKCDYQPENSLTFKLAPNDGIDKNKIINDITDLIERAEDGDSILFFFAGHGLSINSKTYLVLPDTSHFDAENTALRLSDISHFLSKNKRLNIRIFDCCHSGEGSRSTEPVLAEQEFIKNILSEGNDCSITLASCAAHEKSYPDDSLGQGVFTNSLVNAINATPENSPIFAEKIKIDVCNSVQEWCSKRGKTQTPTSNIQISGNIPIAFRRKLLTEITPPENTSLTLAERLQSARNTEVITEKFYPYLIGGLKFIATSLEDRLKPENLYGQVLQKTQPKDSNNIPAFLREIILNRMKSHKTMHTMEVSREERPQIKNAFSSIFEYRPQYNTTYYIFQNSEMPDSFQVFESKSDGYLPSSGIFVYICPLQLTIAVLIGYYFDKSYNEAESNINVRKISQKIYSIEDFKQSLFKEQVESIETSYQVDLQKEINERLSSLDKELKSIAINHQ